MKCYTRSKKLFHLEIWLTYWISFLVFDFCIFGGNIYDEEMAQFYCFYFISDSTHFKLSIDKRSNNLIAVSFRMHLTWHVFNTQNFIKHNQLFVSVHKLNFWSKNFFNMLLYHKMYTLIGGADKMSYESDGKH